MQIFSGMQRDSIYKKNLKYFIIFILLIIYESISSIYLFFTPLFGVSFYFILTNINKKDYIFPVILAFIYIFIFEIDKGFIPFSFIIFFIIYYFFIFHKINNFFSEKNYRIFFHIINAYIGYYFVNLILDYLFNFAVPSLNFIYLLYIVSDILIAVLI